MKTRILPSLFFSTCCGLAQSAKAQYLAPASDSAGSPSFSWSGDLTTGIFRPSAGSVAIGTTGLERIRINSTGVGIGTTTPARLLNVAGAIRLNPTTTPASPAAGDFFIDSAASNTLKFHNGTSWVSVGAGVSGDVLIGGNTVGSIMTIGTNSAHGLALETGSVTAVTIDTSGNVGIGTTNPTTNLHILGTQRIEVPDGGTALQINTPTWGTLRLSMPSLGVAAISTHNSVGQNITFGAMDSNGGAYLERMRINVGTGNVGIGTTSPFSKLNVEHNNLFTPATTGTADAAVSLRLSYSTLVLDQGMTSGGTAWLQSRSSINFATNYGIALNPNGGNVGIGTVLPGAGTRLRVEGQISAKSFAGSSGAIDWSNGNAQTTSFDCTSALSFQNLRDGGSYTLAVTSTNTAQCSFGTSVTGDDAATVTYRFLPANTTRAATSHTIYSLQRIGTVVYVSWITGF